MYFLTRFAANYFDEIEIVAPSINYHPPKSSRMDISMDGKWQIWTEAAIDMDGGRSAII